MSSYPTQLNGDYERDLARLADDGCPNFSDDPRSTRPRKSAAIDRSSDPASAMRLFLVLGPIILIVVIVFKLAV